MGITYGLMWLLAAFFLGLLNCFFGYRLFILTVAFIGLAVGASFGYLLGNSLSGGMIALIVAIVLGLLGAWASVAAYYAFIFIVGALGFALLAAFVAGLYTSAVSSLLIIVAGLIGGLLALGLQRAIIIVATSAQGALSSVLAVTVIVTGGGVAAYRNFFYRILDGQLTRGGGMWFYAGALVWFILFVCGMLTQFKRGKEMYGRHPKLKRQ
ncbi:MAG: DUF4203 domain-containing protein [Candidatus Lindowbacteria bacterium]|nr:DUF4203 domain-containing protein [Candidatus Lindowbacteria bacterium]